MRHINVDQKRSVTTFILLCMLLNSCSTGVFKATKSISTYSAYLTKGYYIISINYEHGDSAETPGLFGGDTDSQKLHCQSKVSVYIDGNIFKCENREVFTAWGNSKNILWDITAVELLDSGLVELKFEGDLAYLVKSRRLSYNKCIK